MKHKTSLVILLLFSIFSYGKEKAVLIDKSYTHQQVVLTESFQVKSLVSKNNIYDTKMILTHLNGKALNNADFYIIINSDNNTINGKSGCNNFSVNYKNLYPKKHIETSLPKTTMMACNDEKGELEQEFLATIKEKKLKIARKKNSVIFKDLQNRTIMEFIVSDHNSVWDFIGKKNWKLIQLERVGKNYGQASIKFNTMDNKLSGNSGCNSFFGTYTANDNFVEFSKIGSTRMTCSEDEINKTEQKILKLLNKKLRFDMTEQTLNFYLDGKLVMMFSTM